jgi:hypothetical protein
MLSRSVPPVTRHPVLAAAALYALLALAFVSPSLLPGHTLSAADYLWSGTPFTAAKPAAVHGFGANYEEADSVLQFEPFLQWARGRLPDVPLWNPHQAAGRPFVANMQSALFSPFSWPSLVLPFWWSLGIAAALKLFCAAFGAHLLARSLGQRTPGALLAGLTYGFGLYFVVWLSWPLSSVWAWLPWVLLGVRLVVHRPGPRPVAALAAIVALQFFGGHPESSFHVLAAGSLFALLELSRAPGSRLRALGRLALGLAAGSALAAIALLPFLEFLAHSADVANRADKTGGHLPIAHLIAYALPDYWGRPTSVQTEGFSITREFYAGALPLMLALWALAVRRTRERLAVAALGAVAIAVVVGIPGIYDLVTALPGFSHAYNTRLIVVGLLALALLAGWGLDEVVAGVRRPRLLVAGAAAIWLAPAVVVLARLPGVDATAAGKALAVAWAWADPTPANAPVVVPLASLLVWLPVAGLAVALLAARRRLAAGTFAVLALALCVGDAFRAGMGQNPAIPTSHAVQPVTPAIARLQAARPARFAGLQQPIGLQALAPNLAMRYGLYDARNYDYPVEKRYDALWRSEIATKGDTFTPPTMLVDTTQRSLRALGLLGVSDILAPPQNPVVPGLRTTYSGPDARIYANPYALPRAWVAGGQRVVAGEDAQRAAVLDPRLDARRTAIVGRPLGPAGTGGSARIVAYAPDRVELSASGSGIAVLSDVAFPGWTATVDGRDAPIERVDYLLRGVAVGPGTHRIVMTYAPASWRAGWLISLLTAVALLAAVLWKGPRRWPARSSAR